MEESYQISLLINGKLHHVQADSFNTTLVQYLRDQGLTGTKISCGEGNCGSCTVLVTRRRGLEFERYTVNSCTSLIWDLHGTEVTTVEGLGSTKTGLHPIQERLSSCHGSQCGFCSPGMVMSMAGVLCANPTPDIEDVVTGLQGNLCRCTGYRPILEAFSTFCSSSMEKDQTVQQNKNEIPSYDVAGLSNLKFEDTLISPDTKCRLSCIQQISKLKFVEEDITWFEPSTVEEAINLFINNPGSVHRQGGTGWYKKFKRDCKPQSIISLKSISKLKEISGSTEYIHVGAGVTYSNLIISLKQMNPRKNSSLSVLCNVSENIGSTQLRNVATVVGGVLWRHPAADILPLLAAIDAHLIAEGPEGYRKISIDPLAGTLLRPGELVTELFIPNSKEGDTAVFRKQARRKHLDLAMINMALFKNKDSSQCRVFVGGMDLAVKECFQQHQIRARNIEKCVLTNSSLSAVTPELKAAIKEDFDSSLDEHKKALLAEMIAKMFDERHEDSFKVKAHQLYENDFESLSPQDTISRPIAHLSSAEQCTGEAIYVSDIPRTEGELVLVPVHSDYAHANILNVHEVDALAVPGVVAWIAAADVQGCNLWGIGGVVDEEVFPSKEVVYAGQIIGVIAAKTLKIGKQAANMIKVIYDCLPAITSLKKAIEDQSSFTTIDHKVLNDLKLRQATEHSIEGRVTLGGQEHVYLETHAALAIPEKEKDEIIVYCPSQAPSVLQQTIANVVNVPQHRITVNTKRIGGAFGGKERMLVALIASVAAIKLHQPCRIVLDRKSDIATTGHKHEVSAAYSMDFKNNGLITNAKFSADINAGCSTDISLIWTEYFLQRLDGGYTLRNVDMKAELRRTNLVSSTSFRGFGVQESAVIIEDCIERIALVASLDPAEVRRNNLSRKGDLLHHGEQPLTDDNLVRCWDECIEQSQYHSKKQEVDKFNAEAQHQDVRRGISIVPVKFPPFMSKKFLNQGSAFVRIFVDGTVLLSHGGVEMGQGLHTKMIQVASRVLQVPLDKIHIRETSTDTIPNASPTVSSSGTELNGQAVIIACQKLVDRLAPVREKNPSLGWEEVIKIAYSERIQLAEYGHYNRSQVDYDMKTNKGTTFNYMTNGAACTIVEVNCATGNHRVLRTDIVMDVGRSLNPAIDIGQIEGAFIQGYGYVTMEEMLHRTDGHILTNNFSTYKIPTLQDIPEIFNVTLLRNSRGATESVFSAKGIGEPGIVLATSVLTALRNAVASCRVSNGLDPWFEMKVPFTAERIFKSCRGLSDEDDATKPWLHI